MAHYRRPDQPLPGTDATSAMRRLRGVQVADAIDQKMGFDRFSTGSPRVGWLVNFQPTEIDLGDEAVPNGKAAVDFYFLDEEGGYFKSTVQYDPYFYVKCATRESEVDEFLKRKLQGVVKDTTIMDKEDLALANHLVGRKTKLIKLQFWNVQDLLTARRAIMPIVNENKLRIERQGVPEGEQFQPEELIIDVKEQDVPYHVRVTIDLAIRVGKWYTVIPPPPGNATASSSVSLVEIPERIVRADPVVMAFDIETTKAPLKFPDSKVDSIMMISYMIDGRGFLITNREIVSKDIDDFEYTPKPEYKGEFTIFNEPSEREVIMRFFEHIRDERPTVIATYNGDFFDWPFVCARAAVHGLDMHEEIGFQVDAEGEFKSTYCVHMDCFRWVKRDSYLPQGSQGLKAVTTAKLGYNPLEIDPELMTPYAMEKPQVLSEYSVSDAVATYYLYMKYVHPFIFSLCNILPLRPDEVLRKGTGTLCEMLLMVQAYERNILLPHKHSDPPERYYDGHMVESETYVGGHVESLEAGVFRSDIPTDFHVQPEAVDELLAQLDAALKFTITTEHGLDIAKVTNYDAVRAEIEGMLLDLKAKPKRVEEPLIYHVDVASMYPNIMTSNRLQPDSMKSERDCAMCDFNVPGKTCDRRLPWAWRGEFFPPKRDEILMLQQQLRREKFPKLHGESGWRSYDELAKTEQISLLKQRVSDYSRKVYHKLRDSETVEREAIICQRENPFYVNTVRDFRDRRYEFKGLQKTWKQNMSKAQNATDKDEAAKMVVLYDSLQLAHKVILNSFYGYVMRKGSRWYSMEMAGVTCLTGATIIQLARGMVERLGRPLELDTDGIWCILPRSFPGDLTFELENGKKVPFAYPCVMLNHLVHEKFTNHQYQTLVDPENLVWETSSDNSIFFEVDGPYKAMMLPSSREEGKGLKKRYAVFNFDGSLAELKGFEMKRRGELQLIKTFQTQLFSQFLMGNDLRECYDAVARIANSWLDVLDKKGTTLEDVDLMSLISENKSMSKSLEEYGAQKSTSICTARRLAEFLGKEMVKDKGLACRYIISAEPASEPVTNRAIPIQIFDAPQAKKQSFLRKWLKKPHLDEFDPRAIIDWNYYRERLSATIQKLVVIPAARQHVPNPVPRVPPPAWLAKRLAAEGDGMKQQKISFTKVAKEEVNLWGSSDTLVDIEDTPGSAKANLAPRKAVVKRKVATVETENAGSSDEELNPQDAPDPDTDYRAWLIYMKAVWKQRKVQFEARKQLFGTSRRGRSRGIQGLLRKQTESAWRGGGGVWEIINLSPSFEPGKVRATAYVNNRLQTVNIVVPREVFVLLRDGHPLPESSSSIEIEKSTYVMPSGRTSSRLYKVTMSERQYEEEKVRSNGFFKSRSIEDVFETQVSAVDRAMLKLGSHCQLDSSKPGLLGKGLDTGFELAWLLPVQAATESKLWQALDYTFLQHFDVHGRHIVVLMGSWTSKASVIEFTPRNARSEGSDWSSNLSTEYTAQLSTHKPEQPLFKLPESIHVDRQMPYENLRRFWAAVGKAIADLMAEKPRTTVTVVQCDRGLTWLASKVRAIHELPTVGLSNPSSSPLPSIAWELPLARRVAKSYLRAQYSLEAMRVMSAHVNVPLSNLPIGEDVRPAVDIVYARRLQQAKHVLWWGEASSSTSMSAIDLENVTGDSSHGEGNGSGIYAHVCLDMSVANLAVNTILTSSYLTAAEGTEQADPELAVDAFSPSAWRCLVAMTKEWWTQASAGDEAADLFVQQLAGWIGSASSRLWDPKLAHQVHTLSQKALSQFTVELKKFGTAVIHSERDGQRIVLATSKKSALTALAFGGLVVKEAKSKEMFMYLDISVNDVYDFLVWLDPNNYCGRVLSNPSSGTDSFGELEYMSVWQIAEYLPTLLFDEFNEWVLQFVAIIAEAKDSTTGPSATAGAKLIPVDFLKGGLNRLEKPLSNRVRQLQSRYIDSMAKQTSQEVFKMPALAGSKPGLKHDQPILAFVKTLLAVFSLTSEKHEYIMLRRKLLGIMHVGDFDPSSDFTDPASKLVVPDVVCLGCMACVDIDVCHPATPDSHKFEFSCPRCGTALDRVFLEERVVQMFVTMVASYQLQDLVCVKCGKIRPNDMAEHCPCSGKFRNTKSVESIVADTRVFQQVGRYFDLRLLNDLIEQY